MPSSLLHPSARQVADSIPGLTALTARGVGQCGVLGEVDLAEEESFRLVPTGDCVGRRVQVVRAGDPMIVRVLGARIGLSHRLAAMVRVTPCDDAACVPARQAVPE